MRILIIEDEKKLSNFLRTNFEEKMFIVDIANDGEKGSKMGRVNEYDVIILDIGLPKKTGLDVCREIRESGKNTPIILLTANDEISSKVELLEKGADDYMTKPFSFEELLARVGAILRRPAKIENNIVRLGDMVLDKNNNTFFYKGKEITLTCKEFTLLRYLMLNREQVLTRGMIMEHTWETESDPFSNTIETHIYNLRRKIGDLENKKIIRTVSGRGYKISA